MKKLAHLGIPYRPYYILRCFLALLIITACDTTIKTDTAEVGEAIASPTLLTATAVFKVDTAQSEITWIGAKVTGRHNGIFKITEGKLLLRNAMLVGGTIVIDMTSMRSTDRSIDEANNKKLTTHLRSADFFDVEKYPKAHFELTAAEPYDSTLHQSTNTRRGAYSELKVKNPTHRITGNLTIKGTTKSIAFPARVTLEDSTLRAKANFNIDRTQWGLVYRADKSLGNQTIHSDVNIGFDIVARQ